MTNKINTDNNGKRDPAQDESRKTGYVIKEKRYEKIHDPHDHPHEHGENGGERANVQQFSAPTAKGRG